MVGPYVNGAALLLGSVAGTFIGPKLNSNIRLKMPMVFGCSSMGLGVVMIVKVKFLAPVVLALVMGALFGEIIQLEKLIQKVAGSARTWVERFVPPADTISQEEFLDKFVALLVLFH